MAMSLSNKWLIFGGSGQLGSTLKNQLLKRGIKPIVLTSLDLDIRDLRKLPI
jgi:dTDP-4-dehydrorhamnose reductase